MDFIGIDIQSYSGYIMSGINIILDIAILFALIKLIKYLKTKN